MKKRLTKSEEFEIMKLVLDKFLWIGVIIMGYGFYKLVAMTDTIWIGFSIMLAGAIILLIFMAILLREYEFMKS
jgi:hypothetical protein